MEKEKYSLEISGGASLFKDDFQVVEKFAKKSIEKISKISDYNNLKIHFKTVGNTKGSHQRKIEVKIMLAKGKKVITMEKEISTGTSDELTNNKVKTNWNIPHMVQDALKALEIKVKDEKRN